MPNFVAIPFTLSAYFGRQFAAAVAVMLAALTALVSLFDFLELLRESVTAPAATFGIIVELELLRVPWITMQILPFAVLLGGIYSFWRLTRSSELVVARASGVSVWQFLAAPVLLATLLGAAATAALSPLSAVMFGRAETLYNAYLSVGGGPLSLQGGELWVRQADDGLSANGVAVLHAKDVHLSGNVLSADKVSVLRLASDTDFLQRAGSRACHLGRRRLGFAQRVRAAARCRSQVPAGFAVPHGSHRSPGPAKLRLAKLTLVLGAAGLHPSAGAFRLFSYPTSARIPGLAGAAIAVRHHGAGGRRIFHAAIAPRRRHAKCWSAVSPADSHFS